MTLASAVFALAAVIWICLPMGSHQSATRWKSTEYLLAVAMFGFGGIGILLNLTDSFTGDALFLLRFAPLIACGVLIPLHNFMNGGIVRLPGLLLSASFILMFAFAWVDNAFVMPILSLAIMGPAILVPRNGYSTELLYAGLSDGIRLSLAILTTYLLLGPEQLIGACRGDKCSIWGLTIGPLGTGNAYGVYLAAIAGFSVLLARDKTTAALATVASAVLVDATSSRSALLAWTVSVLAAHAWRVSKSQKGPVLSIFSLGAVATVCLMGTYAWRPEDFTGRANLWAVAREEFYKSPIFGYGPSYWVRQEETSYVQANYATHNLLWEILITGGVVGIALFAGALVSVLRSAHGSLHGSTLVLVCAWLGNSILEVVAAPGRLYILPGALLIIFIHAQSKMHSDDMGQRPEEQASKFNTRSRRRVQLGSKRYAKF